MAAAVAASSLVLLAPSVPSALAESARPTSTSPPAFVDSKGSLHGVARVVDGDTLYIGQEKIRLYGVDAPEKAQQCTDSRGQPYACGLISKDKLLQKVGTQPVTCEPKQRDQYQRMIAVCSLDGPKPEDLNGWMVENGLAVAYREYSKDYIPIEEAARKAHKGIWDGAFEYPAQWRKDEKAKGASNGLPPALSAPLAEMAVPYTPPPPPPQSSAAQPAQPQGCPPNALIKGNISGKGERIYHVPGGAYYDRVSIEPGKGEKCYASEADAVKDGFRPAGRS